MQIFTKLSNRFKYSKSRKLQASAQTRLTAKTIYAVPGNSVIIDASLADKLTLYWGELSHCATRTPGSVTAIAVFQQRQSAPLFITQPWPIAIGFQSIVRQLGEYEWEFRTLE